MKSQITKREKRHESYPSALEDIGLFKYVETAEEAWAMISAGLSENPASDR